MLGLSSSKSLGSAEIPPQPDSNNSVNGLINLTDFFFLTIITSQVPTG